MPKFNDAAEVEMLCYQMRLADWPRAMNRTRINELFNGFPPYTEDEQESDNIAINVNFLEGTRLAHDARSQFYSAFLKPGNYFTCRTDMGQVSKRQKAGIVVTKHINKLMKRSLPYYECFRSKFASDVLHGIGPSAWKDRQSWRPDPIGVEDVLIGANTYLTLENLPFLALYRSWTGPELIRLTRGPKVDEGWNHPLVDRCIKWIDENTQQLMGSNWPEVWSPEKASERVKSDGGFYVGDQVPTIDCWDFYFWDDDESDPGWRRRIILDSWGTPQSMGGKVTMTRKTGSLYEKASSGEFLFNPKGRKYADKIHELIAFQFADLSAVSPFKYHSVRSLGFLLYAVCHLQNRLRCKFNEAVFENMMMYFRVKSLDDAERALKIELSNRGIIDETVTFMPAAERYQMNAQLAELGLSQNGQLIMQNASSWAQNQDFSQNKTEKTKYQVMAEVNSMNSLISAGLMQAYSYQTFEYREIFRRFCNPISQDADVKSFQASCLKERIDQKYLNPDAWDIEPERVMGAGNKTLEMAISQQLMEYRQLYDPDSQRTILRDVTLAITDDPGRAESLVPQDPLKVTDSIHDAQLAAASLMQGLPVAMKGGINHEQYVEALMADMAVIIKKGHDSGNMLDQQSIAGLQHIYDHIQEHLKIMGQDPMQKPMVNKLEQALTKLMNEVRGFAQRLAEQMQKQQEAAAAQNGQGDPQAAAKVQATMMMAKVKADSASKSHAQKTAQRQLSFQQKMAQDKQKAQMDMEVKRAELGLKHAETQAEIKTKAQVRDVELGHKEREARIRATERAAKPKKAE